MSGPELGLAIWAAVDQSLKWGHKIYELCKSMKYAPRELYDRVVRVESCWIRVALQIESSKGMVRAMHTAHRRVHLQTLKVLEGKLATIHEELQSLSKLVPSPQTAGSNGEEYSHTAKFWATAKFAITKTKIDEAIDDLEKWQATFDISWLLILKIADKVVDEGFNEFPLTNNQHKNQPLRLRDLLRGDLSDSPVLLRPDTLDFDRVETIRNCAAQTFMRGSELVILDTLTCTGYSRNQISWVASDVKNLAQKLREYTDLEYGLFKCKGVVKRILTSEKSPEITFTFIFRPPNTLKNPKSLRDMLLGGGTLCSLSEIIRCAQELAKSVSHVHILGFVHKNIRPETILLLQNPDTSGVSSFLIGFQRFRKDGGMTGKIGSLRWEDNLYFHPRRYGLNPEDSFLMQHDVYSLGVCLLEIGLWASFVTYDNLGNPIPSSTLEPLALDSHASDPSTIKNHLLKLTRQDLPLRMGMRYTNVVETCLTCLDDENQNFGDEIEFIDQNDTSVDIRYIEKVVAQLDSICV